MSMICNLRQIDAAEIDNLLAHPVHIGDVLDGDEAGPGGELDLDKAWHGIHFLLTGSAWEGDEPLCYLVAGGQEVGNEDVGYGPARALRPREELLQTPGVAIEVGCVLPWTLNMLPKQC